MYRPHGIITALATPFDEREALDLGALDRLVARMRDDGVDGIFVCGSQGEFYALSHAEHETVARRAVEAASGMPVIAGIGAVSTRDATELARRLADTGIAALTLLPPSIVKLNQQEIRRHLEAVIETVALPVIVYDHPLRTGNPIADDTLLALAHHPRLVGVKDSTGNLARLLELLRRRPTGLNVLVGNDGLIAAALLAGADGAIASTGNVAAELSVGILAAVRAGDVATAQELQERLLPLRTAFELGSFPVVVKRALALRGLPVGPTRAPVGPLTPDNEAALARVLDEMHLTPWSVAMAAAAGGMPE